MITFHPSLMWLAGIFNMLTYTAATSYVADIFLRRVRVRFRVTVYTQLAVGVYWDSTPLTASAEIFKVYISVLRYLHVIALWYIHWCTVCASILIQGWHRNTEAWLVLSRVATEMVSEHMLTVGRDPRNWKFLRKGSLKIFIFNNTFYFSSLLISSNVPSHLQ